ncbi:hypothetical protein OTU49_015018, partial [Cherax quadricarinatus]
RLLHHFLPCFEVMDQTVHAGGTHFCVLATTDEDLYLADVGSGDGAELEDGSELPHTDHEGSGFGNKDRPYDASYDTYDNDDTEDDDYDKEYFSPKYNAPGTDERHEGSGGGGMYIDPDSDSGTEKDEHEDIIHDTIKNDIEEVSEEITIEEKPTVEELPQTTPPPTLTDDIMDSPIQIHTTKTDDRQVSIFAQPGILAAFIGGAVVGLLCAILLVMFIVYRMRKKDEGSYPLDEPKRMPLTSSYSPNDKEIYA